MRRVTALVFAGLALAPTARAATEGPVFGLRAAGSNERGYFVYALAPGEDGAGTVIVSNVGTTTGTVRLFTADATTGRTTGTVYETDRPATQAGSWITLSARSVTLAPGGHAQVAFTVHVPVGAPPGQWVGGIVAETAEQVASSSSQQKARVQIEIRNLTIVAVEADVPGRQVTAFTVGRVTAGGEGGYQRLFVHLASDGNTLQKPTGRVSIFDANDKLVQTLAFTMDTFLPQTAIDYPILLKTGLGAGRYRAAITLQARGGKTVTTTRSFSVSSANVKQVFTSASPTYPASSSSSTSATTFAAVAAVSIVSLLVLLVLFLRLRRRTARA